jgi:hypothetical protein
MADQLKLNFSKNTIRQINIFRTAPSNESKTDGSQVKLCPSQKEAIRSLCKEHNMAASTFIYDAIENYIDLFPYREKLKRHRQVLHMVIQNLD